MGGGLRNRRGVARAALSALAAGVILLMGEAVTAASDMPWQPLQFAAAPIDNPLKGFVPYDEDKGKDQFPHSLEYFYLPLRAVMKGPAAFDWEPLEKHLAAIAGRGCHAVFRIYLDYPGERSGLPQFLLDAGLKTRRYEEQENHGLSLSPDYEDPRLRAALTNFIAALGGRYDADPRIGFVTVGLLGFWGEWHTYPHDDWFASKAVQDEVLDAFEKAFHRTKLLIRYPDCITPGRRFGFHDDSFAWSTLPPTDWHFLSRVIASGLTNQWRTEPIGGEVRPELWPCLWDEPSCAPRGQEFNACVDATHASWLMNSGVFESKLSGKARERALAGARRLGYELWITAGVLALDADKSLRVSVRMRNSGVAPFYYPWSVELGAVDSTGKLVRTWRTHWQLPRVLPHEGAVEFVHRETNPRVSPGACRIVLRAVNPLANGKPLRFANQTQDQTLPGWLTLGTVEFEN